MQSSIVDGLRHRLVSKAWWSLGSDEAAEVIGEALDELFATMTKKKGPVENVGGLLWTIVFRRAIDRVRQARTRRKYERRLDDRDAGLEDADQAPERRRDAFDNEVEHQRKVRTALGVARSLLPRLGMTQSERVLTFVFDAVERGEEEVDLDEVAAALGSTPDAIRHARDRGFDRLRRVAREAGIVETLDIPGAIVTETETEPEQEEAE